LALAAGCAFAQPAGVGLRNAVAFADYPALANASEIVRRMATPLAAVEMGKMTAASGQALNEQSVDLGAARFSLYVPPKAPPGGYGLLVFVPPWPEAKTPPGWTAVLDRHGVIFVSAAESGNEASVVGRREPLALIAAEDLARLYPIDKARVWVGGFSGGGHVALRLALGYPDVFRGAILNAGSDPIGDSATPLPPRDLFARFQEETRLIYVTGEKDPRRAMDLDSMASLRRWCVFDLREDIMPGAGHKLADPAALARALDSLEAPRRPASAKLSSCRSGIEAEVSRALRQVRDLRAAGKSAEARRRLLELDARFGGLAAPESVDLAAH
jgi:pimeloyl-ACP methyl ester carboxylesterase